MQSELPALYHIRRAPSRCRKKDAGIFRHRCFLTAGGLVPPASQNQRRHTRFMPQQHLTMQTAVSTSTLPTAKSNRRTVNEPCSRMVPGVLICPAYCLRCFAVDRSSRFRIRCPARFPADCSARRRILCRCFRMPRRVRRRDPGRTASPCCTARAVPAPGVAATPVRRRRESAGRRECPRRTRCRRVPWCLIRTNYS